MTRMLRTKVTLAMVVVLMCLGGCSDSPSDIDAYEQYRLDLFELSADQVGDSVHAHVVIEVSDSTGFRVAGAVVRFRVSSGTVVPQTTTSGSAGLVTVEWTFAGHMGGPGGSAYIQACASNSTTRCDGWATVLEIGLRVP